MSLFKKNPGILIWFVAIMLAGYYFFTLYQFLSKSNDVEEDQLYRLGSFQLLNRAHKQSDRTGRYSSSHKLVFQSKNFYSFVIDENIFRATIHKKELIDTMMYAGLQFTVYTNKEYFDKYKSAKEPIYIRVFQIEIGDKKYIDIAELNRLSRSNTLMQLIFWPSAILSLWFALSNKIRMSTKQRIVILCVAWLAIFIGLILYT